MSFGFSIGDIILLSQLAYDLYTTISSGRRAATRDLKELEQVLFSLKCALDHLQAVSKDVLERPDLQHAESGLKEKLDVMIRSCASTLQELDTVTKEYRMVESQANKGKTKMSTLDDVKKSFQVNWQRVRWDREKQSLQQYREKLKSHTDAINLMLTTVIWAKTTSADASSKRNHEITHSLLGNVLRIPAPDAEFRGMVEEMHAMLTKPIARTQEVQLNTTQDTRSSHELFSVAEYSLSDSTFGESSGLSLEHKAKFPSVSLYATRDLPHRAYQTRAMFNAPRKPTPTSSKHSELPVATVTLNNERRAFGAKEYEAFKQRHTQPKRASKPSFLTSATPTSQELQACIPHIFRSTADGKQQTQELKTEITRWTHEFSRFVKDGNATQKARDECILTLLGALNEAVESSNGTMRQLFYETSDLVGFTGVLNQVEAVSKSVRVMKEIEEFQDAKEEWEEQTVR